MTARTSLAALILAATATGAAAQTGQEIHDCIIEPSMVVQIGSSVEGVIVQIDATRGDPVTKGQVIARLDTSVEEESLRQAIALAESTIDIEIARSRVTLAEKQAERARELVRRNAGTMVDLDIAEAELETARQELLRAQENHMMAGLDRDRMSAIIERRVIRSPIDGLMLRRLIGPGEFAHSQAPIAQIASIDPLYVDVFLPTALYNEISVGQRATVRPEAPIGGLYEAEILSIDQVFDAASDTFGVRMVLPNPDRSLPGGVDCTVILGTS